MNTKDDVILLAERLSARDKCRINTNPPDNEFDLLADFPDTLDLPISIYGITEDGMVHTICLDFDGKLGNAIEEADDLSQKLHNIGIPHLLCKSGPADGRHIFIHLNEPQHIRIFGGWREFVGRQYQSLDKTSLKTGSTLRPPGSPHRTGGYSEILFGDQELVAEGIDKKQVDVMLNAWDANGEEFYVEEINMEETESITRLNRSQIPEVLGKLSDAAYKKIYGDYPKGLRSEPQHSFMCSAYKSGLTISEVELILRHYPIGKRYREKGTRKELRRSWFKIETNFRLSGEYLAQWVTRTDLNPTEQVVLEAIAKKCNQIGFLNPNYSQREIARDTFINQASVTQSLRSLSEKGLITRTSNGRCLADTIKLETPIDPFRTDLMNSPSLLPDRGTSDTPVSLGAEQRSTPKDLFSEISPLWYTSGHGVEGLGKFAYLLYRNLSEDKLTRNELSEITGIGVKAVASHLRALAEHGLAKKVTRGWVRGDTAVEEVVEKLGLGNLYQDMLAHHQQETEAWFSGKIAYRMWLENNTKIYNNKVILIETGQTICEPRQEGKLLWLEPITPERFQEFLNGNNEIHLIHN